MLQSHNQYWRNKRKEIDLEKKKFEEYVDDKGYTLRNYITKDTKEFVDLVHERLNLMNWSFDYFQTMLFDEYGILKKDTYRFFRKGNRYIPLYEMFNVCELLNIDVKFTPREDVYTSDLEDGMAVITRHYNPSFELVFTPKDPMDFRIQFFDLLNMPKANHAEHYYRYVSEALAWYYRGKKSPYSADRLKNKFMKMYYSNDQRIYFEKNNIDRKPPK